MTRSLFRFFVLAVLLASLVSTARAGAIIEGLGSDALVDQNSVGDGAYNSLYDVDIGTLSGSTSGVLVEPFALPYLAPGQQVTGATISFYLEQMNMQWTNSPPTYNVQLYGLNRVSITSSVPLLSDWYTGTNDTANTLLDATFVTPTTTSNQAVTYSGSNLVSFIQNQYANAAFSGLDLSNSRYIFFRISPDGTQDSITNYQFGTARNPTRTYHPMLSLTISNGITNIAGRLQFSFNLPQASVASAGVYNTSTGALIRTLWNNIQYQQGTSYGVWDGNDDNGNPVATGSNYQIKLIYHNVQYVWEGTIGNTSANQSGAQVYRSFLNPEDMSVSGGQAFYTVGYNENQDPFHSFVVGSPQVPNETSPGFADVNSAFSFVASDGTRSYWTKGAGGMSPSDTYVVAINNSNGSFYAFSQGKAPTGSSQSYAYTSVADFDATANQANPASGIAVQQSGNYLFVSHANLNLVRVFDKVQGNLLGSFTVTNPGPMHTTANGDVWVISNAATPVVLRYTFANGTATLDRTITGLSDPVGLGVSTDDSLLLVTDGGSSQQIKAFSNTTGASVWTYGQLGGMAVNGPNVTTNSFDFTTHSYVAFQADDTFWVGDPGNSGRILHFSISGNTLVYIEQIVYTGNSYQSTVDLTDATRVFNQFLEYSVNYALPPGGTNGSWTLVRNWAYGLANDSTHNYLGYANGFSNVVTLSNGHTYGFLANTATSTADLFELSASGPARFTGYSFKNTYFPRIYEDGTLRFNVANSTTTALGLYSQPLTGFDAKNNPAWGSPALIASTALTSTDPQPWSAYPMRTEITASGVAVDFDGNKADTGYHLGGIPVGGTSFNWLASLTINGTPTGWFPQDGRFDVGDGVEYAGNYAMALGRNIVYGYHGEFWGGGEASQWVNFLDNGLMVGRFGTYANAVVAASTTNGYAGNSFAPTLVHGPNGNVYLYHNDESNHGGTCRWRINGWDGITELDGTASIGATASLSPNTAGPSVTITSPTLGAAYLNGNSLTLSAAAASSGASITSVQFFDGTTSLGTVTLAPFTLNFSGLSVGTHVITAKATDSNGLTTTSAPVTITIGANGTSAPPPAPVSLSSGTVASQSVSLNWTEPAIGTTSSTIGQIISFQCDSVGDSNALAPTAVAGAPSYSAANFNIFGQSGSGQLVLANPVNSAGVTVPNLGETCGMQASNSFGSEASMSGTTQKLFGSEIETFSTSSISISNVPYALYDLVVYSIPAGVGSGTQTASVTVGDGTNSSTISQSFTSLQTSYTVSTVAFGSNSSVSNVNTVVIQGLTSPTFSLQGGNIAGFQIVERPYDQGTPTSYNIQRAPGTSGTFVTVGTALGTALSFTDTSSLSAGTTYEYRIQAVNSYGASAYSNTVSVTTPGTTSTPPPTTTSFSSWQSQYFTAAQLADATISGPNANPYGSGIPNLLAYALQLNPATAQPTNVPTAAPSNGHMVMTYFVPASITDVSYIPEVSTDLMTWNSGTGYVQVVSTVTSASGNTITVQDTLPTTAPKHFMHLRVTQQ
jgi:hypothetical protein